MTDANARYLLDEKLGKLILWQWKELGYTESKQTPCLHLLSNAKCSEPRKYSGECMPFCADHTSVWNKDGKVAAIVTQPYEIDEVDLKDIYTFCKNFGVTVEISAYWNWHHKDAISIIFKRGKFKK
tara:strand:+ start:709 stop:1086 length:378 start_codon:yes stop_codon:yes gene_type:complete